MTNELTLLLPQHELNAGRKRPAVIDRLHMKPEDRQRILPPRQRGVAFSPAASNGSREIRSVRLFAYVALLAAVATWLLSLRNVNVEGMGVYGLVEVLPISFWVAAALLAFGFCAALSDRRTRDRLYAGYVLALIAMLHATAPIAYGRLSDNWAWKHVSMIDVLLRVGELPVVDDRGLDLYHHWPGFFALNAVVVEATGIDSALSYAAWGSAVADALLLAPLIILYRSFSRSRRLSWAAAWVFYTCLWVTQDYFAPQTLTFLLYVTVLAIVVRRLPHSRQAPGGAGGAAGGRPSIRWMLLVLCIVAAITCSHPLTPVMLIITLAALALPRRNRPTVLPILVGTVALNVAWGLTVARPFFSANAQEMIQGVTQPESNASAGLLDLAGATDAQVLVAWTDRALSGTVWVLAAAALLLRPSLRRTPLPLLAGAPLVLLALNSYDGEMLFRAYMFSLPAMAFGATAMLAAPRPRRVARRLVLPVALPVLFAGFTICYFCNPDGATALYFTRSEVAASRWLFDHAPRGAVVTAVTEDVPAGYTDYDLHPSVWIELQEEPDKKRFATDPAGTLASLVAGREGPVYLMLNRAQEGRIRATGLIPASMSKVDGMLADHPAFRMVFQNKDAKIYLFTPAETQENR
ncbi:glycosyltransferase [Streptomyces sp. NPDC015242]|uniref:glycosyltransferase n=1 Tax=Streptomyces sp. NPDC015242 TaxID=3364951 RepID=UPI0036F5BF42